jgi:pyruvate dehydrogenase (quinone)
MLETERLPHLRPKLVADLFLERVIARDFEVILGFPGDGVNGIFGSPRAKDKLRFIRFTTRGRKVRRLQVCQLTGRLGVCIATSGLGGIHLLNSLYDAKSDCHSVLAITGNAFISMHYEQDVDLDKVFGKALR